MPGAEPGDATSPAEALEKVPNVGPATAEDLHRLGIERASELAGRDADALFERLCSLDGRRHDPCTRDVFAAAIAYVEDGTQLPWWHFSRQRKAEGPDMD